MAKLEAMKPHILSCIPFCMHLFHLNVYFYNKPIILSVNCFPEFWEPLWQINETKEEIVKPPDLQPSQMEVGSNLRTHPLRPVSKYAREGQSCRTEPSALTCGI